MADPAAIMNARILIVDDQQANINLLQRMLQRAGYLCVDSTMNPASVCDLHLANRYDLILLDLQMPAMDGFQVLEALKKVETNNYLPVLAITGEPGHKLRALESGAKDFISKPFHNPEVLSRIHNMLEVRLLHREIRANGASLEETIRTRTAELSRSEELFRALAANMPEALCIKDVEKQTIQYTNAAWHELTGVRPAMGDSLERLHSAIHPDDRRWVVHERRKGGGPQGSNEYRLVRADLSVRWIHARTFPIANPSGSIPWVVEIMEDITQRKESQQQLVHLAHHDALTGLPNRTSLHESLRDSLAAAERDQLTVSLLLLDIDYFKKVNDTLGHAMGDGVLREFAARLARCVRPGDKVGRLGGDEFAVVVQGSEDSRSAILVADRIQAAMLDPVTVEGHSIPVTTSIGIATYPTDTRDLELLIRCADAAMYDAKASGRRASRRYTVDLHARAIEKSGVEEGLRLALARDEFVLHYQPKVGIDSGSCTSVEALIRWERPGHGLVLPAAFIPALEETGLIVPVGTWVIGRACRQIREWERSGLGRFQIAVNVSSKQVREDRFVSQVAEALREHRVAPQQLELEITESMLMANDEITGAALREIKALGVSITIDDFGTGYSNLAYLKRFPIDALKIDIAFIRDVTTNPDAAAIVIAIINMAHSLRLRVIAEGVETREQMEFLSLHGCDDIQGYLLSRPLPADEFEKYLRRNITNGSKQQFDSHKPWSETHAQYALNTPEHRVA